VLQRLCVLLASLPKSSGLHVWAGARQRRGFSPDAAARHPKLRIAAGGRVFPIVSGAIPVKPFFTLFLCAHIQGTQIFRCLLSACKRAENGANP